MSLRKIVSEKLRDLRRQDRELKERLEVALNDSQYYMTSDDAVAVRHTLSYEIEQVAVRMECYTQVLHWISMEEREQNSLNHEEGDTEPDVPTTSDNGCVGA